MKKIQYNLIILACLFSVSLHAQDSFEKSFYVHAENSGSGLALFNHKIFKKKEVISTAREGTSDAKIVFTKGSSWENSSRSAYIDGFVESKLPTFVFPVGGNKKFKPVKVYQAENVKVAYITNDSSFDLAMDNTDFQLLHSSEYWVVQGDNPTHLTFSWDNEQVNLLSTNDLNQFTILGFKDSKWEVIPSAIDVQVLDMSSSEAVLLNEVSNSNKGSITTASPVIPGNYLAFNLGIVSEDFNARDADLRKDDAKGAFTKVKSIHFPFRESDVTRYSTNLLIKFVNELTNKQVRIKLVGHTDAFGSSEFNHSLGEKRAHAVKQMLVGLGVNLIDLEIISKGKEEAKYDCKQLDCTSRETIEDRRVDIYMQN